MRDAYPINFLNPLKQVNEVCNIHCATDNPCRVVVACVGDGRGVVSIIDGAKPVGIEDDQEQQQRKQLLRRIGYKR